jgi:hypothetical protein
MGLFGTGTDAVPIPKFIYAVRIWEQNKHLDFQEITGGSELTAELNEGYYLPDDLATAVATAMSAISDASAGSAESGQYSATYNRANDKITIAQDSYTSVINNCETPAEWIPFGEASSATLNATAFTEGEGSLDLGKSGTASEVGYWTVNFDEINPSGSDFKIDVYVEDQNEHHSASAFYIVARSASGTIANFLINVPRASIQGEGDFYSYGGLFPDEWDLISGDANGASSINQFSIYARTPSSTATIAQGNFKIDNLRAVGYDNGFQLLFNTGTNAASGAGTAMGYDVSADATGASAYESDNVIPNRILSSQPIRRPRPEFDGMNRSTISESGIHTVRYIRTDIFFSFEMMYIPENELKDDWAPFMGIVNEDPGPWARKLDFEFYPKASSSGDYIVFHPDDELWKPVEMLTDGLVAEYRWTMRMREVKPKAGTLSLVEIYTRTPG